MKTKAKNSLLLEQGFVQHSPKPGTRLESFYQAYKRPTEEERTNLDGDAACSQMSFISSAHMERWNE